MAKIEISYPAELTNAEWQRRKGAFAKLFSGKTGIGEALVDLEQAFDGSSLDQQSDEAYSGFDLDLFERRKTECLEVVDKGVTKVKSKLQNARRLIDATEKTFRKNKLIPGSVAANLRNMSGACDGFEKILDGFRTKVSDAQDSSYASRLKTLSPQVRTTLNKAEANWKAWHRGLISAASDPTFAHFLDVFPGDNCVRGCATSCKFWDQLIVKTFPKQAAKIFSGNAVDTYTGSALIEAVANLRAEAAMERLIDADKAAVSRAAEEKRVVLLVVESLKVQHFKYSAFLGHLEKLANELGV